MRGIPEGYPINVSTRKTPSFKDSAISKQTTILLPSMSSIISVIFRHFLIRLKRFFKNNIKSFEILNYSVLLFALDEI
ncbi:hypothetical protein [Methanohalophilus sp.]|uniref:hypothetical protein n=1 Tax=Methanohalophilus sp. TaxID=1966352 RepID=UPI00260D3DE8|nr:hypothetical protein [Methanohalophilus sp.]MDK2892236.1 hypothetical protein [Methanohalophilus sp.]